MVWNFIQNCAHSAEISTEVAGAYLFLFSLFIAGSLCLSLNCSVGAGKHRWRRLLPYSLSTEHVGCFHSSHHGSDNASQGPSGPPEWPICAGICRSFKYFVWKRQSLFRLQLFVCCTDPFVVFVSWSVQLFLLDRSNFVRMSFLLASVIPGPILSVWENGGRGLPCRFGHGLVWQV